MSNAYTPASAVSGEFGIGGFTLTIAANTSNYNVYSQFVSAFGVPPSSVTLTVIINAGVTVSATSTAAAAMTWGNSWSGSPTFFLTNNGQVVGAGGAGGAGGLENGGGYQNGVAGEAGGNAMELSGQTVTITNGSGLIGGGGGGGGGSGFAQAENNDVDNQGLMLFTGAGGGGGQGSITSAAGAVGVCTVQEGNTDQSNALSLAEVRNDLGSWSFLLNSVGAVTDGASITVIRIPTAGAAGNSSGAGAGGVTGIATSNVDITFTGTGTGGNGGALGVAGSAGSNGEAGGGSEITTNGGAGGAAGKAINLTGGTAIFVSGGSSPNVKGAVS